MKKLPFLAGLLCLAAVLEAHPMGNFSVNHYSKIELASKNSKLLFVLDMAEIPTFELLQKWGLQAGSPRAELQAKAAGEARAWSRNLVIRANGKTVLPRFESAELTVADGAGGLPVFRIASHLSLPLASGQFEFEDRNYAERAGWKEIVVQGAEGVTLQKATPDHLDKSQALTAYPQDPKLSPPQETQASVQWSAAGEQPVISSAPIAKEPVKPDPVETAVAKTAAPEAFPIVAPPPNTAATPPEQKSFGTVSRGDFISRTLGSKKEIGWSLAVTLLLVAFGFGALHAFEPGHGKTMVAAYLVGSRGTVKQALFLGGMVTFTHTISVFILGIATLFLSRYIMPDKISKFLGVVSGLTIIWIGGLLLYRRARKLAPHSHAHDDHHHHDHDHAHPHTHAHDHPHHHDHGHTHSHEAAHTHSHEPGHTHTHGAHTHTHDGHTHSHLPEGDVTLGSLIALGASGGLVPCPSALVLLLSAISLGRVGLGLLLLVSFSLGLALVLMATGLAVLFAKHLLPESSKSSSNPVFRLMPVFSAAVILIIGMVMTGVSLGLIPASRFLS